LRESNQAALLANHNWKESHEKFEKGRELSEVKGLVYFS
jgi:hypothetical protein